MKILVIGSGGREHAICAAFSKSGRVSRIYCANGNAGIASVAECIDIRPDDIERLAEFAEGNAVDLTFVGGETTLALGIVDLFEQRGLRIVGASKAAAKLESSKSFAKDLMRRHGVPTAEYFTANSVKDAVDALSSGMFGGEDSAVVVKADGLAAGKGVVVAANRAEAIAAVESMETLVGSDAAAAVVIEECLYGREVSLIMFADGKNYALMPPTRDHKRIGDGDTGPNTGGMGTFTDDSLLTEDQLRDIRENIIRPTIEGCAADGFPFRGILFLGLMMTSHGPKVLEYNVRFGDPETQSILVRLQTDLVEICEAILDGRLDKLYIKWRKGNSATVVLAAEGYPASPRKGDAINGIAEAAALPDISIFHAGTVFSNGQTTSSGKSGHPSLTKDGNFADQTISFADAEYITAGGRVLGVTAVADNLPDALAKAYAAAGKVSWNGMQYRRDIGK